MLVDSSSALLLLHEQQIVHNDVTAANFLVNGTHRVVLCDFGACVLPVLAVNNNTSVTGSFQFFF